MTEKDIKTKLLVEGPSRPMNKIDFLIKLGLGDPDKLYLYRRVLASPKEGTEIPMLRPILASVTDQLLDMIFADQQLWTRLYTLLQRSRGSAREKAQLAKSRSWLSEDGGAGELGTPEVTIKYATETPGQLEAVRKIIKARRIKCD